MKNLTTKRGLRCAIYTRVSTDRGLEQDFNSLDAQREAIRPCDAIGLQEPIEAQAEAS